VASFRCTTAQGGADVWPSRNSNEYKLIQMLVNSVQGLIEVKRVAKSFAV